MKKIYAMIAIYLFSSLAALAHDSAKVKAIELEVLPSGHYLLPVKINNKPTYFILDTGATGSVIDQTSANELKLNKIEQVIDAKAIGQKHIETVLWSIDKLSVAGKNTNLDAIVSQDLRELRGLSQKSIEGILGQDAIKNLNALIDVTNNQLLLPEKKNNSVEKTIKQLTSNKQAINLTASPIGLFTVDAMLDDKPVRLILDTGAPFVILDKNVITRLYPAKIKQLEGQYGLAADGSKRPLFQLEQKKLTLADNNLASKHMLDDLSSILSMFPKNKIRPIVGLIGMQQLKSLQSIISLKQQVLFITSSNN